MKSRDPTNAKPAQPNFPDVGAALAAIPTSRGAPYFAPRGAPATAASWALSRTLVPCLATAFCAATACAQSPSDFAARADVLVPPGASIVRAALPGPSIAALRSTNGGDLRVFNAGGMLLPHALIDASTETIARADTPGVRVVARSIWRSDTDSGRDRASTIRIEEGPKGQFFEYHSQPKNAGVVPELVGLLFDTRKIDTEARAVELEGTLPNATIVKVSLDVSTDLKTWRTLVSDAPVFDFGADGPSDRSIVLPVRQKLTDHYLRLTWGASGSPPIVALKTVGVESAKTVPAAMIELGAPSNTADNAAEWRLPSGLRVSGLHLQTSANNALMPVRVLTRARAGDPWLPVASTVVYRLAGSDGTVGMNPSLPIRSPLSSELRAEALRGYNLTGVPLTLTVEHPPLQVLFIATGDGPFTIATGKAGIDAAALPVATLMPNYSTGAEFALPVLQATAIARADGSRPNSTSSMSDIFNRSALLWGVLGLAVAVLAGLAISLLRAPTKHKG